MGLHIFSTDTTMVEPTTIVHVSNKGNIFFPNIFHLKSVASADTDLWLQRADCILRDLSSRHFFEKCDFQGSKLHLPLHGFLIFGSH